MLKKVSITAIMAIVLFSGCSTKSAEYGAKGAATGALGSSLVGALTDLIVDGKVDTYRLSRNMVGGAIAGGATGAIVGSRVENDKNKDIKIEKNNTPNTQDEKLKSEIGAKNYQALELLVTCKHSDAYTLAIKEENSSNKEHKLAAIALEALIDKDRGNSDGVKSATKRYISLDDKIKNEKDANTELDKLYEKLKEQRRIQGISQTCSK
jgi:hypothetical protein